MKVFGLGVFRGFCLCSFGFGFVFVLVWGEKWFMCLVGFRVVGGGGWSSFFLEI